MLRDKQLMLSDAQVVTTATATASTNYLDTLNPAPADIGVGEELWVVGIVTETVTASGGAANVAFKIQTDDNSSFSTAADLITVAAIAKATLVAGYVFIKQRLPAGCERYIRALITPDTNNLTTGKFDIFLTRNVDLIPSTPFPRANYATA